MKIKESISMLRKALRKYPEYSDPYFLRATLSIKLGDKDYPQALVDIDKAIQYHSSAKYETIYNSIAEMYVLRAKVDMLAGNDQQAMIDMEKAIRADPDTNVFNRGGVKPEEESNAAALQKRDFDSLVSKFPDDYRVYMFRGLFYGFFTPFDEQYYTPALNDLKRAQTLKPNSALVEYLLGVVYQKAAFWTKAAWADISDSGGYKDKVNAVALQYFDSAVTLDPGFTEAEAQLAESLYSLRRYSEAITAYDKVIELDPNRIGAYNDRGLAKINVNDNFGAISDFSKSIELRKLKADSSLNDTYEHRAEAYTKVSNFGSAIEDYSRAIGMKFASQVFLMSISQIRDIYPEFKDISDQNLLEGLRQKYYPNMKPADFLGQYQKNKKPFEDFVLAGLYENRGDSYLHAGNYMRAANEYARSLHVDSTYRLDRWKVVSKTSDADFSIDVQTLNFSQGNVVSLWLKISKSGSQLYDQVNYQIDCSGGKIKTLASARYNSYGNPINTTGEQEWQVIVPETIGETLHNNVCAKRHGLQ